MAPAVSCGERPLDDVARHVAQLALLLAAQLAEHRRAAAHVHAAAVHEEAAKVAAAAGDQEAADRHLTAAMESRAAAEAEGVDDGPEPDETATS